MPYRFHKLAQYVRGWMGYFGISDCYWPIPELDKWLRRRARMRYWKQSRWCRTKVSNLLALGTGKRAAILTAISSKSDWHLSRTLATQTGMTNDWLKAGLGEYSCAVDDSARLRLTITVCSALVNRPVRTRMPGGVGRAG